MVRVDGSCKLLKVGRELFHRASPSAILEQIQTQSALVSGVCYIRATSIQRRCHINNGYISTYVFEF